MTLGSPSAAAPSTELARLELPLLAPYVGVARAVVRAVASLVPGMDDDRLDDLRLAVSEVCTNAVAAVAHASGPLVVRCTHASAGFEVVVEAPVTLEPGGPHSDGREEEWSAELVRSLVDEVGPVGRGGVRLLVRLAAAAGNGA